MKLLLPLFSTEQMQTFMILKIRLSQKKSRLKSDSFSTQTNQLQAE